MKCSACDNTSGFSCSVVHDVAARKSTVKFSVLSSSTLDAALRMRVIGADPLCVQSGPKRCFDPIVGSIFQNVGADIGLKLALFKLVAKTISCSVLLQCVVLDKQELRKVIDFLAMQP